VKEIRTKVFFLHTNMFIVKDEDPVIVLFYKTRMVVEMLLFGWIVPGRKRNVDELDSHFGKGREGGKREDEKERS
jgi:hypothetical protein